LDILKQIEQKVLDGRRLSREDGIRLFNCNNLAWLGMMADVVRQRISGDYVYYNVNRHVNLTNMCVARCKFCAFGRDEDAKGSYAMSPDEVREMIAEACKDKSLQSLHIVSGLHPSWPYEYYLDMIKMIKREFPRLHLKGFTGVEITHFAKISGKSVREVLSELIAAGLEAMPGGGAEILSDRIRARLCPNKATAAEWLDVARTAHELGLKTNASMLYGHIETIEERVDHLLALRDLQDETGGFQTFICFPFHPANTELAAEIPAKTSVWDDLKTMAISRLMLDNIKNIKAYWVMLTLPIAQLALGFGANDIDGTIKEEKIMHAAGAKSSTFLTQETLVRTIKEAGRIPVECDCNFNVIRVL
jgi:aminodeoxyfutalosine synthase